MEIVKAFENIDINIPITILGTKEEPLFRASDIGLVLEISKINSSIRDFDSSEKGMHTMQTSGGPQKVNFLTTKGIKKLICNSRKPNAIDLAKKLNIDMQDTFYIPIEISVINFIQNTYKDEDFIHQYTIYPYKIDLYSPKHKLAIECDEYFHIFQKEDDIKREKFIKEKLNCKFIRFHPNKKSEYLSELMSNINKVIYDNTEYINKLKDSEIEINNLCDILKKKQQDYGHLMAITENTELKNTVEKLKLEIVVKDLIIDKKDNKKEIKEIKEAEIKEVKETEIKEVKETKIKKIIAVNIETGEETIHRSAEKLSKSLDVAPSGLRNNYVNKPAQIRGFYFKSEDGPYWKKPENFNYIKDSKPSKHKIILKSVDKETGKISYYNSLKEAEIILKSWDEKTKIGTLARKLGNLNQVKTKSKNEFLSKFIWTKLESCGELIYPDGTIESCEKILNEKEKEAGE